MTIGFQPIGRRRRREMGEFLRSGGQFVQPSPPPIVAAGSPSYYGTGVQPYVPVKSHPGVSIGDVAGYRSAKYGGVTSASAKSASPVRRYYEQLRAGGYSAGGYKAGYMNVKNAREIRDYAEDLLGRIDQTHGIPPWAEHKLSVARTHIGDVAHYIRHMQAHGDERTACAQTIAARDPQAQAAAMRPTASVPGELSPSAQTGYSAGRSETMNHAYTGCGPGYSAGELTPEQYQDVAMTDARQAGTVFGARARRRRATLLQAQDDRKRASGFAIGNDGHNDDGGLYWDGVYYSQAYLQQPASPMVARLRRIKMMQTLQGR